jgi:TPR repeat protein
MKLGIGRRQSEAKLRQQAAVSRREGALALALRLYRQDATFRGLLEFAIIGAIVLAFLHGSPIAMMMSSSSTSGPLPEHGAAPVKPVVSATALSMGDLLAQSDAILFPRLPGARDMTIDTAPFDTSSPDTRRLLLSAARRYELRLPDQASRVLEKADSSDPNVLFLRGLALATQSGVKSVAAGIELLEAATARGQRQAAGFLGLLFVAGPGVKTDPERGMHLLQQAAEAGDAGSARILGIALHTGSFGTIDSSRAAYYLQMAANRGDAEASLRLAYFAYKGIGVKRDDAEGERLLIEAAESGSGTAQLTLGMYYKIQFATGWIADGDPVVHWLGRAVDGGSVQAMYSLGEFYMATQQPPWHDDQKGAALFQRCAVIGFDPCLYPYGMVLEQGIGTERDIVKAYVMYELVRQDALPAARQHAAELERILSPSEKEAADRLIDAGRAGRWDFIRQVGAKDADGCVALYSVRMCEDPRGIRLRRLNTVGQLDADD